MPKKGGKKGGKKKEVQDWGLLRRDCHVLLEVRNRHWQSLRFEKMMKVWDTLEQVRGVLVEEHKLASSSELKLYVGEACVEEALVMPDDYALTLEEMRVTGGSENDRVRQVITYEYKPYEESILNLPRAA